MKTKISKFGEDFLKLALRIDKHNKGYVDFYIGPEYIYQIVANEPIISPKTLLYNCKTLIKQLGTQGFETNRENYLVKTITAMKTWVEILLGFEMPFKDLILGLHDTLLQPINDSVIYKMKEEFDSANDGPGTLETRMKDLRMRRTITEKNVLPLFKNALRIVKDKTYELFIDLLPEEERINIDLVEHKESEVKWSYSEKYIGNFCSIIAINPKYNMYWTSFLASSAHEGYPGHHTEFVLKDFFLYNRSSQFEHSILLLNSPKLIISEGLAEIAINVLFDYREQAEIGLSEFCLNKIKEDSLEKIIKQTSVRRKVGFILYNLGYYALVKKWSQTKLFRYANAFEIYSKEDIKNQLQLLNDPVLSTTSFSYYLGSKLIMDKYGEFPSVKNFEKLLINPILPSDLI